MFLVEIARALHRRRGERLAEEFPAELFVDRRLSRRRRDDQDIVPALLQLLRMDRNDAGAAAEVWSSYEHRDPHRNDLQTTPSSAPTGRFKHSLGRKPRLRRTHILSPEGATQNRVFE